eukprot:TRINITY_DN19178_c0_g1_i1.p1 TRINITY_DN19178_c0_g1~~TRINITY_DN19178_c0_g1_i1.p1  ORF type:complete len:1402 (+),score=308.97 TRINITY_DN19178_c0_g1_i1:80-4207(+)
MTEAYQGCLLQPCPPPRPPSAPPCPRPRSRSGFWPSGVEMLRRGAERASSRASARTPPPAALHVTKIDARGKAVLRKSPRPRSEDTPTPAPSHATLNSPSPASPQVDGDADEVRREAAKETRRAKLKLEDLHTLLVQREEQLAAAKLDATAAAAALAAYTSDALRLHRSPRSPRPARDFSGLGGAAASMWAAVQGEKIVDEPKQASPARSNRSSKSSPRRRYKAWKLKPRSPRKVKKLRLKKARGLRPVELSPPKASAPLPPRVAVSLPDSLKKLKRQAGEASCIQTGIESLAALCSPALVQKTVKMFVSKGDDGGGAADGKPPSGEKKYGDGIATALPPDQVEKLVFYAPGWSPPHVVEESMEDVARWWSPQGNLWPGFVADDLIGNCNLMQRHHAANQPPTLTLPLFVYSVSVFKRVVWVSWVPSMGERKGSWVVLREVSDMLEQARDVMKESGNDDFPVDRKWFRSVAGLPQAPSSLPRVDMPLTYELEVYHKQGFTLCRYVNPQRGDPDMSPAHDTTLWLPKPIEKRTAHPFDFVRPLKRLPPPGIIEYLHSRRADEIIDWPPEWVARPAIGLGAKRLIASCLDAVDQQKFSPTHDAEFRKVLRDADHFVAPQQEGVSRPPHAVMRAVALEKTSADPQQPTPQMIAHALDIQSLSYGGRDYLLALSGSPCVVADIETVEITHVFRLKDGFDDQPYWHLNAAMRNKQFGNEKAKLTVADLAGENVAGVYQCEARPPNTEEALTDDRKPPLIQQIAGTPAEQRDLRGRKRALFTPGRGWMVHGGGEKALIRPDMCNFSVGTFLLPQVRPLIYYLDRALEILGEMQELRPGQPVRPGPGGMKNFRGLAGVTLDRAVYDTGRVVLWGQYSSSSKDRGVAAAFAQSDSTAAVFTLLGKNCVCIAQWSRFAREHEWLYPPNSMFKVTSCLSEEHQQLLDKANLQLFTMEEVDEFEALEIYVRSTVGRVQGSNAAEQVMQLFQVIHHINLRKPNDALLCMLDPSDPAIHTQGGLNVCRRLVRLGARPMIADKALLKACALGLDASLKVLLEFGASPDAEAADGKRGLHIAASRGYLSVVRLLLGAGADPMTRGAGFTAIEWAGIRRDHAIVELLRPRSGMTGRCIPQRLEEFKPRVRILDDIERLRAVVLERRLPWGARAEHVGVEAELVLFDRDKRLYWLRFEDETTDTYPEGGFVGIPMVVSPSRVFGRSVRRPTLSGGRTTPRSSLQKVGSRPRLSIHSQQSRGTLRNAGHSSPQSRRASLSARRLSGSIVCSEDDPDDASDGSGDAPAPAIVRASSHRSSGLLRGRASPRKVSTPRASPVRRRSTTYRTTPLRRKQTAGHSSPLHHSSPREGGYKLPQWNGASQAVKYRTPVQR